jgi:hypothetical protein
MERCSFHLRSSRIGDVIADCIRIWEVRHLVAFDFILFKVMGQLA